MHWADAPFVVPRWSLVEFTRLPLAAGEAKTIEFVLPLEHLRCIDPDGQAVLPTGRILLYVGFNSPISQSTVLGSQEGITMQIQRDKK